MKIAVVCDENGSISTHFGRSASFKIFSVEDQKVVGSESEIRRSACDHTSSEHHGHDVALPGDCKALLCGGMGSGAAGHFASQGIQALVVQNTALSPRQAVEALLEGRLELGAIHACCHSHGRPE